MRSLSKTILCIIGFFLFILFVIPSLIDKDQLIDCIQCIAHLPSHKRNVIQHLLDGNAFIIFRAGCLILSITTAVILYKLDVFFNYIRKSIFFIKRAFVGIYTDVKDIKFGLITIIPFIALIYFAFTLYIFRDEVFTYLLFTKNPIYYCMMYYPEPNNHVLHSILTNITEHVPLFDLSFRLRISPILVSLLTWAICFSFTKRNYGVKPALFATGIFPIVYISIYYGFASRGYALTTLFFVICLYAAFNIIKYSSKRKDWLFFSISAALGLYTIPSFLYPLLMINLLIFVYNYKDFNKVKQQFLFNIGIVLASLILYSPIIAINGLDVLTNNEWVSAEKNLRLDTLKALPHFFYSMLEYLFQAKAIIVLSFIMISVFFSFKNRDKFTYTSWLIFIISPFVLLFIHNVIPFHRTFQYYTFIFVFLFALTFRKHINFIPIKYLTVTIIVLQITGIYHFKHTMDVTPDFDKSYAEVNDIVVHEKKSTYIHGSFYRFTHQYEHIRKGYKNEKSLYDIYVDYVNADTINNFDYVCIDKEKDRTIIKKPIYTGSVNVYKSE